MTAENKLIKILLAKVKETHMAGFFCPLNFESFDKSIIQQFGGKPGRDRIHCASETVAANKHRYEYFYIYNSQITIPRQNIYPDMVIYVNRSVTTPGLSNEKIYLYIIGMVSPGQAPMYKE